MNFNDIIKQSEALSEFPYIIVLMVLIEIERMGLLEEKNDASGIID